MSDQNFDETETETEDTIPIPAHYKGYSWSGKKAYSHKDRRLSLSISEELYQRLNNCFEWGEKNRVLTRVLEWVCDKVEQHGIGALLYLLREADIDNLANFKKDEEGK